MKIKNIGIYVLLTVLMCSMAYAVIVPRGESIEVRDSSRWNISDKDYQLVNQNPDPAEPGGYVEIRFKVENVGADYAKDVVFELLPEYPFSLDRGMSATRRIGDMYMYQVGKEAFILYYKLRVDKNAVEGNNPIKLKYSLDDGAIWRRVGPFDVRIQTHDAILAVNSVVSEPKEMPQGAVSLLTINIENMADSLLKDIKTTLEILTKTTTTTGVTTEELPFSPVDSTNEIIIKNLDSHESKNITFRLMVDADAESKNYKVPLKIEYSDELGKNYTKNNYIGMIVGSKPDITANIENSDVYFSGSAGEISVKFVNKGSSDIKFVYATLQNSKEYEIVSPAGVYVGNIDSDDYETAEYTIYVKRTRKKSLTLPLLIEYRDANNKLYTENMNINLKLYSASQAKRYGLIKSNKAIGFFITVIIVAAGIFFYRKYKKKKAKR